MYKGESQSFIQNTFNQMYDLIQGTQEENLFEKPDNTPRSLAQAIYETLKIDYNGQQRSNVLVGNTPTSQQGKQGSDGSLATGERVEDGNESADNSGGTESGSGQSKITSNTKDDAKQGAETTIERTDDSGVEAITDNSGRVADDATRSVEGDRNRGDIRVLEEGLETSYGKHSEYSERNRREAESERLVAIAKQNGQFIPNSKTKELGVVVSKRTGESVVYIDNGKGKVYKVKDPYAKAALKNGVQPEDVIYEHTIHNLLFPETEYTFEGISEDLGDARIVLSQDLIQSVGQPTKEQIAEALAKKGLYPADNYSFGNELVSVTDVEGDNVLLGEDGTIYFIDPIIKFKRPAKEIIESLSNSQQETLGNKLESAEAETNTTPTKAQKEAGNYKKGHVKVGTFDITIENPKGSERIGTDANGHKWSITMQNTYGYLRGTEGVDGDHIDVFIADDIDSWNGGKVFVVDQYNEDDTFDEHKVMLGFNDAEEAEGAYYANYSSDWKEKHPANRVTAVNIENFEKWINSSHRKTKAFVEYKSVNTEPTLIGRGAFGNIYDQFKGKAKEAIAFLMRKKEGEATGTLHHKDIGDIDLVWGDSKQGLSKILAKHPEVLENLQGLLDEMNIIQHSDNRILLESNTHKAVVSKKKGEENVPNWLLTAYEKKEKSVSASSSDIETEPNGKENGTATLQNGLSANKDNTLQQNNNELGKNIESAEAETNTTPTKAQKEAGNYKKGHVKVGTFNITIENPHINELYRTVFTYAFKDIVSENGKYNIYIKQVDGTKRVVVADLNTANVSGRNLNLSFEEIVSILKEDNWIENTSQEDAPKKINVEGVFDSLNSKGEAKLSEHEKQAKPKNEGALGLVSDERMAELKERLRKKLGGQMWNV